MKQAVIIATTPTRSDILSNCIKSLGNYADYPILVVSNDDTYSYELGKMRYILDNTDIDEFILLHDTCEIKNPDFINQCFRYTQSVCLSDSPTYFGGYLGKYKREVLSQLTIPVITTKEESIEQEIRFNCQYVGIDQQTKLLFDDFGDVNRFEAKWGKMMMRIENDYLIKYKSTWNETKYGKWSL